MSFVILYTFAAVVGLARKVTGAIIPAEAFDSNWTSPLAPPTAADNAPAVGHKDSLEQGGTVGTCISDPAGAESAPNVCATVRDLTSPGGDLKRNDSVKCRTTATPTHELAQCQQELDTARKQLASEQTKAAEVAAVWQAMVIRLQDRLKAQVLAREDADRQAEYAHDELRKTQRQLQRSATAAAVHIHTVEHEVVFSRAAIGALTSKLEKLEHDKKELVNEWNHARHLLSGAYGAQRESAAKIVAMEDQAATVAAKLKAAEYETNKLSIYLEMANKMGDMQIAQARAQFAEERRSFITTLAAVALDCAPTRRRLAIARSMADAVRVDAQDAHRIVDKQKVELDLLLQDTARLTMRNEDIETPQSVHASEMAGNGQCDLAVVVSVNVHRQDSAVDDTAGDIGVQVEQRDAGHQDDTAPQTQQAEQIQAFKEEEEVVQANAARLSTNLLQEYQQEPVHATRRELESREAAAGLAADLKGLADCQVDPQPRKEPLEKENRALVDKREQDKAAASDYEIDCQEDLCQARDARRAAAERRHEAICELDAVQGQVSETLGSLEEAMRQLRDTETQGTVIVGGSVIGKVVSTAGEHGPRLDTEADLRTAQVFADLNRKLLVHHGAHQLQEPRASHQARALLDSFTNCQDRRSLAVDRDSHAAERGRSRLEAEMLAIQTEEKARQVQELGRVCEQQREQIQEHEERVAMLEEQLRWLWDAVRWGGVPAAHVRRDSC